MIKIRKEKSVQQWFPIEEIYEDGLIKLKNNSIIKIIRVIPINYNLKSDFEKESILNSYKLFLKTCNFDIQILIQTNKENINKNINYINEISKNDSPKIKNLINLYNDYLIKLNQKNEFSSKKFFILIKINPEKIKENNINFIREELNINYLKIKENLIRCGNKTCEIVSVEEVKNILFSFFNIKNYKNNIL